MSTLAARLCSEKNVSFAQAFRYQYVIAPQRLDVEGMLVAQVGTQWLHYGADLRRADLLDCNGRFFGICLGVAVDHDGRLPAEALSATFDSEAPDALDRLETYLPVLSGRYALITQLRGRAYFHCDPVGMIGAVYAPETRRIAASPFLCIDREVEPHPLYDHDAIRSGVGTYGFDHTCDKGIVRLNANHRLDLETFETTRFWPRRDDPFTAPPENYARIYDEMIAAGRKIIDRMTRLGPTALPLTGGNDSRILLALTTPESRGRIGQVFSHVNTYANRRDAHVAARLCALLELEHECHDKRENSIPRWKARQAVRRYQIASGVMGMAPVEIRNGLAQHVTQGAIVMRGHQTNIMRGQYLVTSEPEKQRVARWQIRMMRLVKAGTFDGKVAARFKPDFDRIQNTFPQQVLQHRAADFMFFETLVPCALGPMFPGQDHAFYLSPFNSRRLVQLSMQFDTEYRMTAHAVTTDFLLRADPSLAGAPLGSEFTASLEMTEETEEKRTSRLADARRRCAEIFATGDAGQA